MIDKFIHDLVNCSTMNGFCHCDEKINMVECAYDLNMAMNSYEYPALISRFLCSLDSTESDLECDWKLVVRRRAAGQVDVLWPVGF